MSSFTGVSVVTGGSDCRTWAVDADTDSGYHLLVVNDYYLTVQTMTDGDYISSHGFMVGGLSWKIFYYPNGHWGNSREIISFLICLSDEHDGMEEIVDFKIQFSFVDQVEYQKPTHIRATKTHTFSGNDTVGARKDFLKRDAFERAGHLKGDGFTVRCDIMVCKGLNSHDDDGAMPDIQQHFDYLLQNKVGADVTFEVSGETFVAHRCVLAARSTVFMAQLFGPMTEGTTSAVIQIKDMEAKVFAALLRFIYTDSLPEMDKDNDIEEEEGQDEKGEDDKEGRDEEEEGEDEEHDEEEGQEEDVLWLQDLLVAADRYDLQRLKFLCGKQLSEHIGVSSVTSTLALAEQHHCHKLKEACFKFIQVQSPKCLDKVMATDGWEHMSAKYPSVLKELVAKLVSNQKKDKKRKRLRM